MGVSQPVAQPTRACDPLLASVHLHHSGEFYPYGFPAVVRSNSPFVLEAARQSWSSHTRRFKEPPIEIRCMVADEDTTECPPEPVFRAQRTLLIAVADRDNHFCCDRLGGFAFGWVTSAAAADTAYLRYCFVEAMAYCLLEGRHALSLHAACVALEGHGMLLAGDSGAGKTSLAYACARRGWTYISDDATVVPLRGRRRMVLGDPVRFRFRSTAGELFPEFKGLDHHRRGHGKPTVEIPTSSLPDVRTGFETHVGSVIFLNRGAGDGRNVRLLRVSESEAFNRLDTSPWPHEQPSVPAEERALRRLASAPAYELRYRHLEDAVERLEQLVRGGNQ